MFDSEHKEMKYLDYIESRKHGSFDFPFAFYNVNTHHPRYQMLHHWHPEFELIHILEGTLILQLDGCEITATAGDSFFITGGMVHSGIPKSCHYQCIVFDMDFFLREQKRGYQDLISLIYRSRIPECYFPRKMKEINNLVTSALSALISKQPGYELIVQGCFYQLLGTILQKNLFQKTEKLPDHLKQIKQFKTVISIIQKQYHENITLADMAASIHMNPNYFCRFFKSIAHQTPVQYLNFYRIESACEKISSSDKSMTEIALECGFNDISYFVKVFKRYKLVTPTEYLRQLPG